MVFCSNLCWYVGHTPSWQVTATREEVAWVNCIQKNVLLSDEMFNPYCIFSCWHLWQQICSFWHRGQWHCSLCEFISHSFVWLSSLFAAYLKLLYLGSKYRDKGGQKKLNIVNLVKYYWTPLESRPHILLQFLEDLLFSWFIRLLFLFFFFLCLNYLDLFYKHVIVMAKGTSPSSCFIRAIFLCWKNSRKFNWTMAWWR